MLTLSSTGYIEIQPADQGVEHDSGSPAPAPHSLVVKKGLTESESAKPPRGARRRGKGSRRKRKGGWRSSKALTWQQVKQIAGMNGLARRARTPLNAFATITPADGLPPSKAKRRVATLVGRLGQALKRRGVQHVGLTVYERTPGGQLHGHHLAHVPREHDDILARWADGDERHVAPVKDSGVVSYITKQRHALPPDFLATLNGKPHQHQPGAEIPGKRWTPTKAMLALAARETTQPVRAAAVVPKAPPAPSWQFDASGQFMLFGAPSGIRLEGFWAGKLPASVANDVLARQKGLGLTQGELARLVGISRPQLANALAGRFGLSRQPVARLQAVLAAA